MKAYDIRLFVAGPPIGAPQLSSARRHSTLEDYGRLMRKSVKIQD